MSTTTTTLTLAIIKPHVLKNPFALRCIKRAIKENHFTIRIQKTIRMDEKLAEKFYAEHKGRFFYNRLVEFMCSSPMEVLVLERFDAINKWREMLGPTKTFKAVYSHPDSIRALYGLSDTRNACHGSDSIESALKEIRIFFPDFNSHVKEDLQKG
ncbi:nucleoside diphosphate kinase 6 [Culicoides brevitarsis]|uniref:nucleoside diphosphate kinase 6 n=1 Tax=Culicoides brevitarsis TaxID=469753 RepID=UPI00307CC1CE